MDEEERDVSWRTVGALDEVRSGERLGVQLELLKYPSDWGKQQKSENIDLMGRVSLTREGFQPPMKH